MDKRLKENKIGVEFCKIPPQAIDIEESILGTLLNYPMMDNVVSIVRSEYFYKEANQVIYESLVKMYNEDKPIDLLSVTERLKKEGVLELIGGSYYLALLYNKTQPTDLEYYCHLLFERWLKREVIRLGYEASRRGYEDGEDGLDLYVDIMKNFEGLNDDIVGMQRPKEWDEHLKDFLSEMDKKILRARDGKMSGIDTGLEELNKITNGWQNGDMIVLASRPSMGKTALGLFFGKVAAKNGVSVLIISLEMPATRLMERMVLGETDVKGILYRKGLLKDGEIKEMCEGVNKLYELPITIDDDSYMDMNKIKALARIYNKNGKCDLLIIDYLQLITPEKGKNTREQEVADMSRRMKGIAKSLDIPVIVLCQLSREVEKRGSKKAMLSDLRESGAIEQDADLVLFPHRPYYYSGEEDEVNDIEINVAKHRNGVVGVVEFGVNRDVTKFYDKKKEVF